MKIAHVGLASFYSDDMTYQDSQLAEQNVRDGHDVLFISNAGKYVDGKIVDTGYTDEVRPSGVHLIRLPYEHFINAVGTDKFRKVKGLYKILEDFAPDVILCHNMEYWSILDVIKYKKDHPQVKMYADTHTASHNSGRNWLSLHILHRGYYRWLVHRTLPHIEKLFYITWNERQFAINNFKVPEDILEFYPLGGNPLDDKEYSEKRKAAREELNIADDEYLFIHTGKLDEGKKTESLLKAFSAVPELRARLIIIGMIPDFMEEKLLPLIEKDKRVTFLGWKSANELISYLCASDLYIQPGVNSATMQNAICMRCPIMAYPHDYYTHDYDHDNFIWIKDEQDMIDNFKLLSEGKLDLAPYSLNSRKFAEDVLDYKKLAARLYE